MAEIWGEEQLIADGFERVYVESEWYGEPWAGLADIDGKPHYFEMYVYDHSHEVDEYQVWPASEAVAELEREQWAIYARWYERQQAGEVGQESHPGHGGVDARYDELELLLAPHRLAPDGARRLVCELRFVAGVDVRYRVEGPDYWLRWRPRPPLTAARYTFDYQYDGCGNWPFNTAYAATFDGMSGVVTHLGSLDDIEILTYAGLPVITSQSFISADLDGAGYGTSGHLMCIAGFTKDGDIVSNDPASSSNDAVRNVYKRRQFENVWLRTKRLDANGKVKSGTGGVAYVLWPERASALQRAALAAVGIR